MKEDSAELDEAMVDLWANHFLGDEGAEKMRGSQPADILRRSINIARNLAGFPLPCRLR